MIKVYFDWNVMAQMKDGQWPKLKDIMMNSKRFWKPYSTSHISDILSSFDGTEEQNNRIEKDLNFISELTENSFIYNDGKDIVLDFEQPNVYYQQRIDERNLFENFTFDSLFKIDDDNILVQSFIAPYVASLKQMPLDEVFKEAFSNPETVKQIDLLLPGLKDNLTMEGFLNSFGEAYKNLNNSEDYKELRKMVQTGLKINRDIIYDSKDPYSLIEKSYKNLIGVDILDTSNENDKNAPSWFNKISSEYLKLDMHGYQEDNVSVSSKGRKETFKNTTEDAFHCAFASMCHFYITNDKKSYKKANQVFEKLQLNTFVCKPDEFLNHYESYLDIKEDFFNIQLIFGIIKDMEFYEEKFEETTLRTYLFPLFIFDFFNKISLVLLNKEPPILVLERSKPTNGTLYIFEVQNLVKKMRKIFGNDLNNFGEIREEEFAKKNWIGRSWLFQGKIFRLALVNGHVQLYLDFEESKQTT